MKNTQRRGNKEARHKTAGERQRTSRTFSKLTDK